MTTLHWRRLVRTVSSLFWKVCSLSTWRNDSAPTVDELTRFIPNNFPPFRLTMGRDLSTLIRLASWNIVDAARESCTVGRCVRNWIGKVICRPAKECNFKHINDDSDSERTGLDSFLTLWNIWFDLLPCKVQVWIVEYLFFSIWQ